MTTSSATHSASAGAWRPRGTAGLLALAASPTLALMAGIAANDAHPMAICLSAEGILPINGMTAM